MNNKFVWLVRRELWEARIVWIVPALLAAIVVVGAILSAFVSHGIDVNGIDADQIAAMNGATGGDKVDRIVGVALGVIAGLFYFATVFTQFFYAIDTLYGDRRDRSVLFWKSMPITDAETVLSKLFVASVIMPVVAAAAALVVQVAVFAVASAKLAPLSMLQGHLWSVSNWGEGLAFDVYVIYAGILWNVPVIAFSLLVSAWATRAPTAYAVFLPPAIGIAEYIVFRTSHLWHLMKFRTFGMFTQIDQIGASQGFGFLTGGDVIDPSGGPRTVMHPLLFLATPEVWGGVLVGAALIGATIWLRRYRDETT
jgi:ABC-2 type transport system permease protein